MRSRRKKISQTRVQLKGKGVTSSGAKGSYVLLIQLPEEQTITAGSRSAARFPGGCYAYVGSAMGGFEPRLRRHLRASKRPRWHIDYLLMKASISDVILGETDDRVECAIAQALSGQFDSIPGFGSSDCRCPSHLFFAVDDGSMKLGIMAALSSLGIESQLLGR